MDVDIVTTPVTIIPQVISTFAGICFFISYSQLPYKSVGVRTVLYLGISDFLMHITLLALSFSYFKQYNDVFSVIFNTALRFSIFWVSSMSVFMYRALTGQRIIRQERYLILTFIPLFLFALGSTCACVFLDSKYAQWIFIASLVAPLIASLFLTAFCCLRTISRLKLFTVKFDGVQNTINNLYSYAVVQLITILPALIYSSLHILYGVKDETADTIVRIPLGLAGFVNALVFFFSRKLEKAETPELHQSLTNPESSKNSVIQYSDLT